MRLPVLGWELFGPAQGVAALTGLNAAQVLGGICLLWSSCLDDQTDATTPLRLTGCFSAPGVDLVSPLVEFRLLERCEDGSLRVLLPDLERSGQGKPSRRSTEPCVYFLRVGDDGPIKIGFTRDIIRRLRGLQTAHPEEIRLLAKIVVRFPRQLEREVHARFAHLRISGEWFRAEPELLDYVRGL